MYTHNTYVYKYCIYIQYFNDDDNDDNDDNDDGNDDGNDDDDDAADADADADADDDGDDDDDDRKQAMHSMHVWKQKMTHTHITHINLIAI